MCDWLVAVFDMVHSQFLCVLSWVVMVDMVHSQFVCVTGWLLFLT